MIAVLKAQHAEVRYILNAVKISILEEGNRKCGFIGLSCGAIIEVNLSHPWGSNRHDDLSQEISVVIGGEGSGIHSVSNEAIIKVALSLVDIGLMVVTQRELREVAVEVQHNVAININEVVTLALLSVNKALHLVTLVQVERLRALQCLLVLGSGELGLYLRLIIFIWVLEAEELYICLYLRDLFAYGKESTWRSYS